MEFRGNGHWEREPNEDKGNRSNEDKMEENNKRNKGGESNT